MELMIKNTIILLRTLPKQNKKELTATNQGIRRLLPMPFCFRLGSS